MFYEVFIYIVKTKEAKENNADTKIKHIKNSIPECVINNEDNENQIGVIILDRQTSPKSCVNLLDAFSVDASTCRL